MCWPLVQIDAAVVTAIERIAVIHGRHLGDAQGRGHVRVKRLGGLVGHLAGDDEQHYGDHEETPAHEQSGVNVVVVARFHALDNERGAHKCAEAEKSGREKIQNDPAYQIEGAAGALYGLLFLFGQRERPIPKPLTA